MAGMALVQESWTWNVAARETRPTRVVSGRRILVVEDDVEMGCLLGAVLRADGHDVVVARNGAEGVDHLLESWEGDDAAQERCDAAESERGPSREKFDLIVSDFRMPGWTGLEILEMQVNAEPAVPTILITAFGAADLHQEARRLGAAAVLDKPFDLDRLRRLVRVILAA